MAKQSDNFDWDEDGDGEWDDASPYPENPKAIHPIVTPTVTPDRGPLFGHWGDHIAYLQKRERELVEELEITREDIMLARKRQRKDGND